MKSLEEMDAETDERVDAIILEGLGKAPPEYVAMLNKPYRDYIKILNKCQDKDVDPEDVMQATSDTMAAMLTEMFVRFVPHNDPNNANRLANKMLAQIALDLSAKMNINFGAGFVLQQSKGETKQ